MTTWTKDEAKDIGECSGLRIAHDALAGNDDDRKIRWDQLDELQASLGVRASPFRDQAENRGTPAHPAEREAR